VLWPFSIQAILGVIYARLAIFVIEHFGTRSAVGLVSAGSAIRSVLLLLPTSMALLSYPLLSVASIDHNPRRIREIIVTYLWTCTAGVGAGLALLVIFIHPVCRALHIPAENAGFIIAFVAAGLTTIGTSLTGVALQAFGGEHSAARLSFLTLGLAVLYNVVAVAYWGVWGTVVAMVLAELTALVAFGLAAMRAGTARLKRGPESIGDVL
jgi:O-antigen/teichoic acid export membrane protein